MIKKFALLVVALLIGLNITFAGDNGYKREEIKHNLLDKYFKNYKFYKKIDSRKSKISEISVHKGNKVFVFDVETDSESIKNFFKEAEVRAEDKVQAKEIAAIAGSLFISVGGVFIDNNHNYKEVRRTGYIGWGISSSSGSSFGGVSSYEYKVIIGKRTGKEISNRTKADSSVLKSFNDETEELKFGFCVEELDKGGYEVTGLTHKFNASQNIECFSWKIIFDKNGELSNISCDISFR